MSNAEQKPVAYINIEERKLEWAYKYMSWDTPTVINLPKIPLYTEPPQRTWVDLTDNEVVHLKMLGRDLEFVSMTALRRFARDIVQTIKEKNT